MVAQQQTHHGRPAVNAANVRMGTAEQYLKTALRLSEIHRNHQKEDMHMYLSFLLFDTRAEVEELDHLQQSLQLQVQGAGLFVRDWQQTRGDDTSMETCGSCCVARFCDTACQKLVSRKGSHLCIMLRHRHICPLLRNGATFSRVIRQQSHVLWICWISELNFLVDSWYCKVWPTESCLGQKTFNFVVPRSPAPFQVIVEAASGQLVASYVSVVS